MPDFYGVKLDVNQIKQEIHFWNQQPSYINALHSDSIPNYIAGRKSIVGRREGKEEECEGASRRALPCAHPPRSRKCPPR